MTLKLLTIVQYRDLLCLFVSQTLKNELSTDTIGG